MFQSDLPLAPPAFRVLRSLRLFFRVLPIVYTGFLIYFLPVQKEMNDFLPVVVPFFGAAVFLSWTVTCCAVRRTSRIIYGLQSRVEALELQRTSTPAYQQPVVPVVQTVPYQYPPQHQQPPPPYNAAANRVMAYYIPPPFAQQQQQQARASAPPL